MGEPSDARGREEIPADESAEAVEFVTRAGRTLARAPDYPAVVRMAARVPVPTLADIAAVFAIDGKGAQLTEVAHVNPAEEPRARALIAGHMGVLHRAAARLSARHGPVRSQWLTAVNPTAVSLLFGDDPELVELMSELGVCSLLLHPLHARGRFLGVLGLARIGESPAYGASDLAAGLILARRAALAMDDARMVVAGGGDRLRRRRLDEAVQRWAHTFEAASWGAAILDAGDWRIESANRAFAEMHGYDNADDLVGRLVTDFVAPSERGEVVPRLFAGPDKAHTIDTLHLRRDGTVFPVLASYTAMPGADGEPAYRTLHLQDLSELRRTEARLQSAQRMEAVGRLAGGVAHEVNNMMTIVLGFADFLTRDRSLSAENRQDVAEMQRAAERAAGITQQLLAFTRRQVLQAAVLDLNEVIGSAAQLLRALLPADVRLELRLDAPAAWVRVDQTQLEQVLINLAFNARDAMPAGGTLLLGTDVRRLDSGALQERIGIAIPPGEYVVLFVRDTGVGMDPDTLAHIFEPFFTTKGLGKGTGLGLSTVYGIVKQSGGYITVRSEVGAGTTFSVFLPQVSPPPEDDEFDPVEIERGTETVLVVEDEEAVRLLASRALREHGYRTLEATDGAGALEILAQQGEEVDLILSDVVMPLVGGRELRERLIALGLTVPILFMSAYTGDEVLQQGLVESGDPFIQKPFTPAELTSEIRRLLDESSRHSGRHSVVGR